MCFLLKLLGFAPAIPEEKDELWRLPVDRSVRPAPNGEGKIDPGINAIKLINGSCPVDWWRSIEEAAIVEHYSESL